MKPPRYAELQVISHFSFLRGASSCAEFFATARELGIDALAVADRNSLAGVVQAFRAARETGVRLVVGCRLDLLDGMSLLVYPTDREAYARLCRLLTIGKKKAGKGKCHLDWQDVVEWNEGLLAVLVPDEATDTAAFHLRRLSETFPGRCYLALTLRRRPNDQLRLHDLSGLAARYRVPTVVTNDVLYHEPARRMLQDVVTCIRHNVTIDEAGFLRERHADRYLKPPQEMHRLFERYPEALARTLEIVERCRFSLDELKYQYPEEREYAHLTPQEALEKYTWEGAAECYPKGIPDIVRGKLNDELRLIEKMKYAPYFLTVRSIVQYARSIDILCQGRGSAANSAVCYVLGITAIHPEVNGLLFERFVSEQRGEPPDIDVDFEHERREEVIQWIYKTYGTDRSALCATVIRYRSRAAMRDVGRALGMPEDVLKSLSSQVWGWSNDIPQSHAGSAGLNVDDRRIKLLFELARQLVDTPRHLSQHPGGFVLTRDRLDDLVPIEPAAMAGRMRPIAITPASPSASPAAPPMRACTSDSPATWPTTRRSDQPMALRVPNSRVRRATPDTVNSTARARAIASTMTDSHVPRLVMSDDALDSEPETVAARSDCALTVASGSAASSAACTSPIPSEDAARTYTVETTSPEPDRACATSSGR